VICVRSDFGLDSMLLQLDDTVIMECRQDLKDLSCMEATGKQAIARLGAVKLIS
jgi:hypothetical protein